MTEPIAGLYPDPGLMCPDCCDSECEAWKMRKTNAIVGVDDRRRAKERCERRAEGGE